LNPISQSESGVFVLIPIRHSNTDFFLYTNMMSDNRNNCDDIDLITKMILRIL